MKEVLITGITGTLGTSLTKELLSRDYRVTGISRDEYKQAYFPYRRDVNLLLGDIRDPEFLRSKVAYHNLCIHCAALKYVDVGEEFPLEFYKTNVLGTNNIVNSISTGAIIFTSTDKACYPVNAYGASKLMAERVILSNNERVIRYGNVLNSRGSIIEKLLKNFDSFKLTVPGMTRFWIKIEDIAKFIVDEIQGIEKLVVPSMKAAPIEDVYEAVRIVLNKPKKELVYTGIRPGEKLHETLLTAEENNGRTVTSDKAEKYTIEELCNVIEEIRSNGN